MARAASAGVVLFRRRDGGIEVLLVHPGGPYWTGKDAGAWSIPKGEFAAGEAPDVAARREFAEEIGRELDVPLVPLTVVAQSRGKVVHAFAAEGDLDPASVRSNRFEVEWPPRSGQMRSFPEIDRAAWFTLGRSASADRRRPAADPRRTRRDHGVRLLNCPMGSDSHNPMGRPDGVRLP